MAKTLEGAPIDAVLVLAGGEGRRLGGPKAWLEWRGTPLLLHVVRRLAGLADRPPLVAAGHGMELPPGPYDRVEDIVRGAGPLGGLAAGLSAVEKTAPDALVAVAACDGPFVDPRLFSFLAAHAPGVDVVLPEHAGRLHPLAAVWRAGAASACRRALDRAERRVLAALDDLEHAVVPSVEFPIGLDPERLLLNLNDRSDLLRAGGLPE
ncbi:MAG TPA: molybdenum cofactor guanylyltransferase [Gemmatimonadota bacterium]|nr:molybdenum cofactor guanylyltransferase [Gemmatimonadota bacterium]